MSLNENAVGYWKMNEASWSGVADEVIDSSPSGGNHGVAEGGATTAAGKLNNCGTFSGSAGTDVNVGNDASLRTIGDMALMLFADDIAGSVGVIFMNNNGAGKYLYRFQIDRVSRKLQFFHRNSSSLTDNVYSTDLIPISNFDSVGFSISGNTITFYINGANAGSGTLNNAREYVGGDFGIGGIASDASSFNGLLDNLIIYNTSKTDQDFLDFDNSGAGIEITFDDTPPGVPDNFNAGAGDGYVDLTWLNPVDPDFESVMVRKSESIYPATVTDGEELYSGTDNSYQDTDVVNGTTYYYSIFARDEIPNWSDPAQDLAIPSEAIYRSINKEKFIMADNLALGGTKRYDTWSTVGRPSPPEEGEYGYNVSLARLEIWTEPNGWEAL